MPTPADPVDAIAAALARLRGRRMPRPPWGEGPHGHGEWQRSGAGEAGHHGGPHHHGRSRGPWSGAGPGFGPGLTGPVFAGSGGRFGGPARLRLLEALAAASHPLSVGEIADAIGVDQPRASRLVQQAVQLGFVRREADPDDARRTRIALTDEGAVVARGFRGERREAVAEALAEFTDAERAELARLLAKLADAWPR